MIDLTVADDNEMSLDVEEPELIQLETSEVVDIGTKNYNDLNNLPSIEGVTLQGEMTLEDLKAYTRAQIDALLAYKADLEALAAVATSGDYTDLSNTPQLATVATSGNYNDLSNKPNLATVATSGNYNDLSNKPNLATVATSGSYNDLTNKPTIVSDVKANNVSVVTNGVANLAKVASSGKYSDLTGRPTIPDQNLYIVKVGYDSDEDEYYLDGTTFTDICDAYDEGMALILIYVDEDDYAYEYVLSTYAPDDDFVSFSSSFSPAAMDTFTVYSDDSIEFLEDIARTSALINDSLFVRGNSAVWEGTCSTAAGTSAKYVNCASFTADDQDVGTIVFVTFSNTNTAAVSGLTLNVQNRGAKPIKCLKNGQVANLDSAGDLTGTLPFFYDGTNWVTWYDTAEVYQQYQAESGYSYWRPLVIGKSSSATEGFTPSTTTDQTYVFKTLEVQPSTGSIRMGCASMYKGSYTSKVSPTTLTANRTITLPDASGTMALTNDIPENTSDLYNDSGFITLADLPIYNGGVG